MNFSFSLLLLFLVVLYVLVASNALEFQDKTLQDTGLVKHVVMVPTFHMDRLNAYLKGRWEALRGLPAQWRSANP